MAEYKRKQVEQEPVMPETSASSESDAERDELAEATQQFIRSLFRAGVELALLPVNMLPPEPRQHFKAAGREFTRGLATLAHELADDFDRVVEEAEKVVEEAGEETGR
jgi:hypothetical protein